MDVDEDDSRPVQSSASSRAHWQWQHSNRSSLNDSPITLSPSPLGVLKHVASKTSINGGPVQNTPQSPPHTLARQPSALATAFVTAARVPAAVIQFDSTRQFDRQTTLVSAPKTLNSFSVTAKPSPSASISAGKRTNIGEYFDLSRSARRRHILLSLAACVFIALAIVGLYYLSKYERPQHYDLIVGPAAYPANSTANTSTTGNVETSTYASSR